MKISANSTIQIFSVYDVKAESYLQPFYMKTIAMALREFETVINNPQHQFHQYPEDYVLFHTGQFYEDTGLIESKASPESLGVGIEFIKQAPEEILKAVGEK